jgi:hypothetical protein
MLNLVSMVYQIESLGLKLKVKLRMASELFLETIYWCCLTCRSGRLLYLGQCYKTFLVCNLRFFAKVRVFAPGKPFHYSLVFAGKAEDYPIEESFRSSFLGQGPGLAHKQ